MKASDKDVTRGEDRKRKEIVFVKLDEIVSDPDQPREYFYEERLKDLARTIKRVPPATDPSLEDRGPVPRAWGP